MLLEKFENGNNQSVGLELELHLLNKDSLELENQFEYIYENIDEKYKKNIAPEFLGSMLEINTPVFNHACEISNYLKEVLGEIKTIASKKDLILSTSGVYALKSHHIKLSTGDRYNSMFEEHQSLLKDFTICGIHVHVGFESFDEALKAFNFSLKYLPLFVALSASSPFYDKKYKGIHSFRTKIFDRLPKASIPEYFDSYESISELYELLKSMEVINSGKDIWWDVRIQPKFKTVEFRVCDAINDLDRIEVIVALFKGLCKLSKIEDVERSYFQILKQNMWSATRYSMDGFFIDKNSKKSIKTYLLELATKMKNLNILESSEKVFEVIKDDSIAQKMIKEYAKNKDMKKVQMLGVFK